MKELVDLVGGDWNMTFVYEFICDVGKCIIIPTDELIFFRGVEIPPAR